MKIEKIEENKEKYIDLLLEADPEENVVKKYIDNGDMYIGIRDDEVVCEIIIIKVNDEECELKNIATVEKYRGKGYVQEMIKYVFEKYKETFKRMIVETSENMIPFYVLNGFTKYHHTVKNFFIDNYEEAIYDDTLLFFMKYLIYKNFMIKWN